MPVSKYGAYPQTKEDLLDQIEETSWDIESNKKYVEALTEILMTYKLTKSDKARLEAVGINDLKS